MIGQLGNFIRQSCECIGDSCYNLSQRVRWCSRSLELLVGDASRMYTETDTQKVMEHARQFVQREVFRSGSESVSVLRTRRARGYIGGSIYQKGSKASYLFSEMLALLEFALSCRLFTVGNVVVQQILGSRWAAKFPK